MFIFFVILGKLTLLQANYNTRHALELDKKQYFYTLHQTHFTNHNRCSLLGGLWAQPCELHLLIDTNGTVFLFTRRVFNPLCLPV